MKLLCGSRSHSVFYMLTNVLNSPLFSRYSAAIAARISRREAIPHFYAIAPLFARYCCLSADKKKKGGYALVVMHYAVMHYAYELCIKL